MLCRLTIILMRSPFYYRVHYLTARHSLLLSHFH